jgi:hypothetical protein
MDESGSQKIKVKIGKVDFENEGPTSVVDRNFQLFMSIVEKMGSAVIEPEGVSPASGGAATAPAAQAAPGTPAPSVASDGAAQSQASAVSDDLLPRLYKRDGDNVSLLALPRSEDAAADALIVLLYGYQRLAGKGAVTAVSLMRALRQSGINIPRIDTVIAKKSDYVLAAGANRGRVYSLNNRGVAYAEGVVRKTLD